MPVDSPNAALNVQTQTDWRTVRDVLAGESTMKARGTVYIPKLHEQEDADYRKYVQRATFFNATARTWEAMVGFIFRKPPQIEAAPLEDFLGDTDLAGTPFIGYARRVVQDVAAIGRGGSVVDWSDSDQRPYAAYYRAEDIVNWRHERIGGTMRLTLLVLRELVERQSADEFLPEAVERFRCFRLTATTPGNETTPGKVGTVTSEVWERVRVDTNQTAPKDATGTGTASDAALKQTTPPATMARRGTPLPDIPFVFHGAEENGPAINKAPLADIAHINASHFRNSADLENGRHVCGVPTPWAAGFGDVSKFFLGSSHVWSAENPDAKCGFLEFEGTGLDALSKGLEEKQGQMASLGARLIEPQKKDAEAYETVQLRAAAETSALAKIGLLGSESLTSVLDWAAWWTDPVAEHPDSLKEKVKVTLNADFTAAKMDPTMLTALVAAFQQSAISRDTLFYNLQRGEVVPSDRTLEEEQDLIDTNPPIAPPIATDPNKIDPATGKPFPPAPKPGVPPPAKKKAAVKK